MAGGGGTRTGTYSAAISGGPVRAVAGPLSGMGATRELGNGVSIRRWGGTAGAAGIGVATADGRGVATADGRGVATAAMGMALVGTAKRRRGSQYCSIASFKTA